MDRRTFLGRTAAVTGAALLTANGAVEAAKPRKRTATDLVPLGRNGPNICRLGMGTGSNNGWDQKNLGREDFNRVVRHAYDRGITYFDTADAYGTHGWVKDAVKGLPREKLWIQTKMEWRSADGRDKPLEVLDRFRKELGVDYVDSLLIHCATNDTWHTDLRHMMDAFAEAKDKKLIRAHGISCHGLPALRRSTTVDWVDVQLARINPQGRHVDGVDGSWGEPGNVPDAMREIKAMHDKGRGIIGMKLIGNGDFKNPDDRERSIQYAMKCGFVDAAVIGFSSTAQIDEAIERIDRALAG